ncbi:hypothetical protein TNCV_2774701 [Trichonephila clavipes]|nr:hypothetical protein TNCV_2774701 [Trichonephila clavipes]
MLSRRYSFRVFGVITPPFPSPVKGHLKFLVYEIPGATVRNLVSQIFTDIANRPGLFDCVQQSIVRRCRLGYDLHDGNFEQFL